MIFHSVFSLTARFTLFAEIKKAEKGSDGAEDDNR